MSMFQNVIILEYRRMGNIHAQLWRDNISLLSYTLHRRWALLPAWACLVYYFGEVGALKPWEQGIALHIKVLNIMKSCNS